jgi:hypothetical protein
MVQSQNGWAAFVPHGFVSSLWKLGFIENFAIFINNQIIFVFFFVGFQNR